MLCLPKMYIYAETHKKVYIYTERSFCVSLLNIS